jgi:hypothetical protein
MSYQAWMRPGTNGLMPLNRDWMDVARYLDGGAHPDKLEQSKDGLVAACELQRLQLLAWTSALRGASQAAGTTRGRIRDGIAGVRMVLRESAALHAAIAARRSAGKAPADAPQGEDCRAVALGTVEIELTANDPSQVPSRLEPGKKVTAPRVAKPHLRPTV